MLLSSSQTLLKNILQKTKLRQALRCARDVLKLKVELRNNRIVMVESGLSYSLTELPDHIKNEIGKRR